MISNENKGAVQCAELISTHEIFNVTVYNHENTYYLFR